MQWAYIVLVGVLSLGARGDDCDPFFKAGDKIPPTQHQCCKKDVKPPEPFVKNVPKCVAKYPLPAKVEIADLLKPEVQNAIVCAEECIYEESGLLTPDKKIDVAALKKMLTTAYPERKDIPSIVDKCYSSTSSSIDKALDCKSGAYELQNCMRHDCFLNHCPKDKWNATPECEDLKKKVEKCPNFPMAALDVLNRKM